MPCLRRLWPLAAVVLSIGSVGRASAQELPRLRTEVAFPNLRFDRPVTLAYPDDGSQLLFVVEQHAAKIWSFPNDPQTSDKRLFLDLPRKIATDNEEGLLGLAFHPRYKENGQFFVYYSAQEGRTGRRSVVSRFRVRSDDPRAADPGSEERIWVSEPDPFSNHNGGHIAFGPDGYLYITLGDSGAADDPLLSGQNPTDWWGSILRIDVDKPSQGKPYGIPEDNPRLRDKKFANWAPEVYAIGLRNVWKFSFDRLTGTLWAADVGQNLWEEVNIISNGGNYGWSAREGLHGFYKPQKRPVRRSDLIDPIFEYPHAPTPDRPDHGLSITGGYVYRGQRLPELVGVYVFGDYETGRIWGLRQEGGKLTAWAELIDVRAQPKLNIAGFGEDAAGELYILAFDGRIYRLAPAR
ncbi:MAG: protein up-regulated by thyroid hormone-PQQ-dependent glucose dehydrogenase [Isosphaeraceae bacterium]|nr:MAG: protein up-regulated by thyroid hormone-PQQ-dependent glucose dehydrogenase [Isosphaeraceae bacterium]